MIVDSSAALAILCREPEAEHYATVIATAPNCRMSVANMLETSMGRKLMAQSIGNCAQPVGTSIRAIDGDRGLCRDAETVGRFLDMLGVIPNSVATVEAKKARLRHPAQIPQKPDAS